MDTKPADRNTYLYPVLEELMKPWPDNRTVNIVCHGHSVPAGYLCTPVVDTLNAYPHLLLAGIKERFAFAVVNVIVTAIGGETSENGAARFEADVFPHHPDVVTIDYSLNDRGIGLKRAEAAWRKMIEAALSRQCRVILLTPTLDVLTERTGNPSWSLELPRHAEQVRRLAGEYGIGLADSYQAFQRYIESGGDVIDLLSHVNHPNRLGHQLVARELLRWFPAQ